LTCVFEALANQHRTVLELLRTAGSMQTADKRLERWAEARRRLLAHERAEAEVVYSKLAELPEAGAILEQHVFQAEELESAVDELDATDAASTLWIERLRDVMAMLADHVRDEELEFFPRAQRWLGQVMARELEEPLQSAERDVLHDLD